MPTCVLQLWAGVEEKLFEMMSEPGKITRQDRGGSNDAQPRADSAEARRQRMQMYAEEDGIKAVRAQSASPVHSEARPGWGEDFCGSVASADAPARQRFVQAVAAGAKPSATKNAHRSW